VDDYLDTQDRIELGFDFARKLRDSSFRERVRAIGFGEHTHVITSFSYEDAVRVMLGIEEEGPFIFAIENPLDEHGFDLYRIEP
jgi:hypothetical protein